ncbi:MAG TPA: nucleoside recognition domain-containing protein [Candidatus Kapabacteria bacterium]|nr:nucleoside recognition domain-containing protein [Candidatus Kapabacteria bacterium]
MLNYIWLGLIAIAIFVAVGRDISEESSDRFRNNEAVPLQVLPGSMKVAGPNHYTGTAYLTKTKISQFYGVSETKNVTGDTVLFAADLVQANAGTTGASGTLTLTLPSNAPSVMTDAASNGSDATKLIGQAAYDTTVLSRGGTIGFVPPSVHFRILTKVATDGILKTADVAVTLALGLIGVMALWLGIMKIAEAAGLVALLAKLVKPIMIRLFPEVPPDHPAIGAMVMNMTANFLGLSNAATPLGLKAMEELNKLNPNAGTATNAMCMFLTINTTALTLVPATVIAIRLTLGSASPADIIMPTFLATLVSLILGVMFTRFIERFFPIEKEPPIATNE